MNRNNHGYDLMGKNEKEIKSQNREKEKENTKIKFLLPNLLVIECHKENDLWIWLYVESVRWITLHTEQKSNLESELQFKNQK